MSSYKYKSNTSGNVVEAIPVKDIMANAEGREWTRRLQYDFPPWLLQGFAEGILQLSETKAGIHVVYPQSSVWAKMDCVLIYDEKIERKYWSLSSGMFDELYTKDDSDD